MKQPCVKRLSLGPVLVGLFAVSGIVGPWMAPYDPLAIDLHHQFATPSREHLLGTADNGVDLLSALLHGARLALVVGASVTAISLAVGTLLGLLAGVFGRAVDHGIMAIADVFQAFPALVLNMAILAVVDRPSLTHLILALSVSAWVLYARLVRAEVLWLRECDFVLAAVALGASRWRILLRHLLPNAAGPLVVQATTAFGGTILAEASLSFLGLGPGTDVSWGALLDQGSGVLLVHPHLMLITGSVIAVTVLGFNLVDSRPALRRSSSPDI